MLRGTGREKPQSLQSHGLLLSYSLSQADVLRSEVQYLILDLGDLGLHLVILPSPRHSTSLL